MKNTFMKKESRNIRGVVLVVAVCIIATAAEACSMETENAQTSNEVIEITDTVENNDRFETKADEEAAYSMQPDEEAAHSMPLDEEAKMQDTIGVQIVLPENENWIKDICYYYKSDNTMEIQYYDVILKADCTLYAVKGGILELSDIAYDSSLEENWAGWTSDSQYVLIKVQRSDDGKDVLATWEYGDCAFGIQTTVPDKDVDINSIPKTAITVIQNF